MIRVGGHEGCGSTSRSPGGTACGRRWRTPWASGASSGPSARSRRCSSLARDLHEVAPGAWLYNYTNPMAALVWAIYAGTAHQRVVGVCMSPENTAQQLAELVGVPFEEIAYLAGRDQPPVVDPAAGARRAGPLPAAAADRAGRPRRARAARPRGDVQAVRLLPDRVERAQRRTWCPGSFRTRTRSAASGSP